jgi:hypothetical protein
MQETGRWNADQGNGVPQIAAQPGTLGGLIVRLEAIIKLSQAINGHAGDIREKVDGTRAPGGAGEKSAALAPIRSGFISLADELIGELQRNLSATNDALEHVWSKVS